MEDLESESAESPAVIAENSNQNGRPALTSRLGG
jgi:hypothetical protein